MVALNKYVLRSLILVTLRRRNSRRQRRVTRGTKRNEEDLDRKTNLDILATMVVRNFRDKREKRCCTGSHKQCKTLFKHHMVRFKIISLYIYKDIRLKILGRMSHVTIITRMAT